METNSSKQEHAKTESPFLKYKYRNQYKKFIYAAFFYYVAGICVKLPYAAQMVEMIDYFGTTRANVALGLTIYYFAYGFGQFLTSAIMDWINIKKMLVATSVLTAIFYSCIGLTSELWQVWVLFGINGLLQAVSWGGINYFIGKLIPNDCISYANKLIYGGFAIANTLTYGFAGLFVALLSWKATFVFFGVLLFISIIYFMIQVRKTERCIAKGDEVKVPVMANTLDHHEFVVPKEPRVKFGIILAFCFVASFVINGIGYSVNNWIPNMLSEVHNFPNSLSIVLTLVLPLVAFPTSFILYSYYDRKGNIFLSGVVLGGIVLLVVLGFVLGYASNFFIAMLLCLLFRFFQSSYVIVYGNNTLMKLKNYISPAKSSLIVNGITSFGAGLMPYISGVLLDSLGWTGFFISMLGLSLFCFIFSVVGYLVVRKDKELSKWF